MSEESNHNRSEGESSETVLERTTTTTTLSNNDNNNNSEPVNLMEGSIRDLSLYQQFTYGQRLWVQIEKSDLSSNDPEYQAKVKRALQYLMMASFQFDKQALISKNEELDDIRTDILKYLLIPYYIAELYLLLNESERIKGLKTAKIKINLFFNHMENIGLIEKEDLKIISRDGRVDPVDRRNELVSRGKRDKETREKLEYIIKKRLEMIGGKQGKDGLGEEEFQDCGDEEVERNFCILLLKQAISKGVAMLEMLDVEINMLTQVEEIKKAHGGKMPAPPAPKPSGIGNFKILPDGRQVMLDKVFRPSHILPTITPEQAAEWEMHNGGMVKGPGGEASKSKKDDDDEYGSDEEDGKEQDLEKLKKARDWDDWKDDNPRGSGNIMG